MQNIYTEQQVANMMENYADSSVARDLSGGEVTYTMIDTEGSLVEAIIADGYLTVAIDGEEINAAQITALFA